MWYRSGDAVLWSHTVWMEQVRDCSVWSTRFVSERKRVSTKQEHWQMGFASELWDGLQPAQQPQPKPVRGSGKGRGSSTCEGDVVLHWEGR